LTNHSKHNTIVSGAFDCAFTLAEKLNPPKCRPIPVGGGFELSKMAISDSFQLMILQPLYRRTSMSAALQANLSTIAVRLRMTQERSKDSP
jgi:hypothetical protein